ncbi:MAG: peptidoglycan-binding protein LysM, partial [Alphaproteobacteria bacterium]|nr:peptidoglycan-binding protein LysM [Alphaproteobacteria bacterium]
MSFIKDAGEKLFGRGEAQAAQGADKAAAANAAAGKAIEDYIASMKLTADGLKVDFDGANATVSVSGAAPDQ